MYQFSLYVSLLMPFCLKNTCLNGDFPYLGKCPFEKVRFRANAH